MSGRKLRYHVRLTCVLPRAIHIGGWKRKMDLLTTKGLWLLPWFPQFYQRVKRISSFVREKRAVVCAQLETCAKAGLASVVKTA